MTAIDRGASSRAIERASARCSRAVITARDFSVGSMSNARSTTPESYSPVHGVTGVHEHPEHLGVLAEHLGGEAADPALLGGRGQVLQQDRTEPTALLRILDQEGDLGRVGVPDGVAVVGPGRDDLARPARRPTRPWSRSRRR